MFCGQTELGTVYTSMDFVQIHWTEYIVFPYVYCMSIKFTLKPWLGSLADRSIIQYTKRLQVWSPVGAHTGGNWSMFFSLLPPSLSKINKNNPGWWGLVAWAPAWEQKDHQFDPQSGHMSGLWTRSLAGGMREATNILFLSFPSSL